MEHSYFIKIELTITLLGEKESMHVLKLEKLFLYMCQFWTRSLILCFEG